MNFSHIISLPKNKFKKWYKREMKKVWLFYKKFFGEEIFCDECGKRIENYYELIKWCKNYLHPNCFKKFTKRNFLLYRERPEVIKFWKKIISVFNNKKY